jgi:hypothetical protein
MPASPDSVPSLTQPLDDLYTIARVLAGPEEAGALVAEAYRNALQTPVDERPSDRRAWLLRHLLDAHTSHRRDTPSSGADAFRTQAAETIAARALPVAFAACSTQERLILTLDVQAQHTDTSLRDVLDRLGRNNRDLRAAAWASLRAALRDTLTGPERMLVDVALSEDALRSALHLMLTENANPAPSSLRRDVATLIRTANASAAPNDSQAEEDEESGAPVLSMRRLRQVAAAFALVAVLGLGGYALLVGLSPEPTPEPDLVDFSARRAEGVRPDLTTADPVAAEKYVQTQWSRRLTAPVIAGATIEGVGALYAGPVDVPVLLYADSTTGGRIAVVAYTYALLDRIEDRAPFSTALRDRLSQEGALIARDAAEQSVVLWRRRDDVFVAVTSSQPPAVLARRIRP